MIECHECGRILIEEETYECHYCGSTLCKNCIKESWDFFCDDCSRTLRRLYFEACAS